MTDEVKRSMPLKPNHQLVEWTSVYVRAESLPTSCSLRLCKAFKRSLASDNSPSVSFGFSRPLYKSTRALGILLRSSKVIHIFVGDCDGIAQDVTESAPMAATPIMLSIYQHGSLSRQPSTIVLNLGVIMSTGKQPPDVVRVAKRKAQVASSGIGTAGRSGIPFIFRDSFIYHVSIWRGMRRRARRASGWWVGHGHRARCRHVETTS